MVAHADISLMVCEDQEQVDKLLAAHGNLPRLAHIVVMETKGLRSFTREERAIISTFAEVEALGRGAWEQGQQVDQALAGQAMDDIGRMIYTSGSTGKPKGAMISWRNICGVAPGIVERLQLTPATSHLSYLPLCHVAEQMLTTFVPVYLGTQVHFGESIRTVQEDLREVAPNMFLGVPRIWEKMHASLSIKRLETGRWQRALMDRAMAACAPLADQPRAQWSVSERLTYGLWYWLVLRALQNFLGIPLVEVYGLTESTGMVLGHRLDQVIPGTVGEPIAGVQWRLADNGELQIRGDMVFAGYYKNSEATAATLQVGWLRTCDVVRQEQGQLKIVDRLKDIMITAGGKNLTPSEIENTMKASPYIKECVIVAEGRKFVAALVMVDAGTVGQWAQLRRIPFTHLRSLAEEPQVLALIDGEIVRGNQRLAQVSQNRKFHWLTKELDHEDGEVTATMKVRRASIYQAYSTAIEALYR